MANRLADETSPYLLQHQNNPVNWHPWGEEAFRVAREEDKPIFLSVGYSSCHWCHVMEHESFEDTDVAALLNEGFVSIKVDREERPDVDEAYMTAVQLSSGRGGWPMSVFLTPDGKPFFAGTYFPKEDRQQIPGFKTILSQVAGLWKTRRTDVEKQAEEFDKALRETIGRAAPEGGSALDEDFLARAVKTLASDFDPEHAGFGSAPKFPPHSAIEFLMAYALRPNSPAELREMALGMALGTLEKMAQGGIHDHVGGGFHRYSTDQTWLLPHFEKMLYDNALMLGNYSRAAAICHEIDAQLESLFARTAAGVANWALREMRGGEGLFYSALDADSEGEEGKYYVWLEAEVRSLLADRADAFLRAYRFEAAGNFHDEATGDLVGTNIPHLAEDIGGEFDDELRILLGKREGRVAPGLDDKAIVAWNGLMIQALAESGLIAFAESAVMAILEAEKAFGALPHMITKGTPAGRAFLDDYASFALGVLTLATVKEIIGGDAEEGSSPDSLRAEGARLISRMIELFYDEEAGAFFSTSKDHEDLFGRSKPVFDSPTPSANALAVRCLLETGDRERAERSIRALLGWMERAPQATEALYSAALPLVQEAKQEPAVAQPMAAVAVRLEPREIVAVNGVGRAEVIFDIPAGMHLNGPQPPARWLVPTAVKCEPLKCEIHYPPTVDDAYEGATRIPIELALPGNAPQEFELTIQFQACTDTECLLPQERRIDGVVVPG